jgi:hypothetical protein
MKAIYYKIMFATMAFVIVVAVTSCTPEGETMGDAGQTLVKLVPIGFTLTSLNPVTTLQTQSLFEIRRNVPGNNALQTTTTVILKYDNDTVLLKAYNLENSTNFIPLPPDLGTTDPPIVDNKLTVVIGPDKFSTPVMIKVPNAFNFDFAKKYALAFQLQSVEGEGRISKALDSTVIVQVMSKNTYEGLYKATGWRNHPTLGVYTVDVDKYLKTVSQYTVETYTGDYSPYRLRVTVDPLAPMTNNVTVLSPDVALYNNTPLVNARGIPGGYNRYDPAEKKYYLYYYYNTTAPRVIHEQFTLK